MFSHLSVFICISLDPVMTIIGPMPNWSFIDYLLRMLVVRGDIVNYGRVQIFALMRPTHYVVSVTVLYILV